MMELHQKLYTYRIGLLADACWRALSCEERGDPFLYGRRRGGPSYAMAHSLKALPSLACEARANQSNRQNDDFVRTELTESCSGFI